MAERTEKKETTFEWIKSARRELNNVSWPTRNEVLNLTAVVFVITVIISLYLGVIDFLLSRGITFILGIGS